MITPEQKEARAKAEIEGRQKNYQLGKAAGGAAFAAVTLGAAYAAYRLRNNRFIDLSKGRTPLHTGIDVARVGLDFVTM